jgi:hypothetical protein
MQIVAVGLTAFAVASTLFASYQAPTSQTPKTPGDLATRHLKVRLGPDDPSATPGERVTLTVDVTPAPKMHVYAPGQSEYIPVSLELEASKDFKAAPARFPASQPLFLAPINMTAKVYNKPFQITQTITLATTSALRQRAGAKDTLTINGTLKYQACDDLVCYRPDSLPVSWKIGLAPGR